MRFKLISWPFALGSFFALTACSGPGAPMGDSQGSQGSQVVAAPAQPVGSGQPPRNQCDAQAAQSLVGQPFGATTLEQARAAAGADEARMLRPDSSVTKEYKLGRLNVLVDTGNRVTRVYCG